MSATEFLAALMDGTHPHSLCAKPKGGTFYKVGHYVDPDELLDAAAAATARGEDVSFGAHPLHGPVEGRGTVDDVAAVRCLVADLDWYDPDAHADKGLPAEATVRNVIDRLEYKPAYIVETGHGLQGYWALGCDVTPQQGAELTARLHLLLAGMGLKPERADLASSYRVPGTVNYKTDPVDVRLDGGLPELRYQPEYLDRRLPAVSRRSASGTTRGKWTDIDRDALHPHDLACLEALERLGGHGAFVQGDVAYIVGPTSKADRSASIGHTGPGAVHMFTSSWPPFRAGHTYSLDELERIERGDPVERTTTNQPDDIADMIDALAAVTESYTPVDLHPAFRGELHALTPTVLEREGGSALFYRGQVDEVHGDSGVGKGFVLLTAAIQELKADNHVIWVDAEDPNEALIVERFKLLGVPEHVVHEYFHYINPKLPARPEAVRLLLELVDEYAPTLVVLDSVGELFGLEAVDENKDNEVGPWMRRVARPLALAGPAVVLIDHGTKAADNPLYPSGSKRKRAAVTGASYLLELVTPFAKGQDGRCRVVCAKDRHGTYARNEHVATVDVKTTEAGALRVYVYRPIEPASSEAALPVVLAARAAVRAAKEAGMPVSTNALCEAMRVKVRRTTRRAGVELAVGRGHLRTVEGPRRSVLHEYASDWQDPTEAPQDD